MTTPSHRSTAWLNGQLQFHIELKKQEDGSFNATAPGYDGYVGKAEEEHVAVNYLKTQLRDAAMKGDL